MSPKEIDAHIMQCPYFGGKNTINRIIIRGETVHIGNCGLEWHHRKICPSSVCICAKAFGLERRTDEQDD